MVGGGGGGVGFFFVEDNLEGLGGFGMGLEMRGLRGEENCLWFGDL